MTQKVRTSYTDHLKDEISAKMVACINLSVKRIAMMKAARKACNKSWKQIVREHDPNCSGGGCIVEMQEAAAKESSEISCQIQELLARGQYFLIDGWSDAETKMLGVFNQYSSSWADIRKKAADDLLKWDVFWMRKDEMIKRLLEIPPLYLSVSVDLSLKKRYDQIVKCYIFGLFEAVCILARAFVELLAKNYIRNKGYGDLLSGEDRCKKKMTIPQILTRNGLLDEELVDIYRKICRKADLLLHDIEAKIEERDSLDTIRSLQKFVHKFPKSL